LGTFARVEFAESNSLGEIVSLAANIGGRRRPNPLILAGREAGGTVDPEPELPKILLGE
jgi:hypothetical protein